MKKTCWLAALALVAGCTGQPAPPTAPGPVTFTSLTITGDDLLLIGKRAVFAAVTETGAPAVAQWKSDAPNVASMDAATGTLTAIGTGTATISAEGSGGRGTKSVRVLPDFGGRWVANYRVTRCEATGDFLRFDVCNVGVSDYFELDLIQNRESIAGGTLRVTGYDTYDDFRGENVAGSVGADGVLSFVADARDDEILLQIQNVRFETRPGGLLTGTFEQAWSSQHTRISGTARFWLEVTGGNRLPR
jgi:hypothetical protein